MGEVLRIEINVPLGTKLQEVIDEVLTQATAKSKSQFAAAIGLGIRPETLSRRLKKIRLACSDTRTTTQWAGRDVRDSFPERDEPPEKV